MIDDLKALAVFATTVEQQSFRKAARVLGLSPSVVSHHVSSLERRLGVMLLYRTTRRLSLTSDGERLYGPAQDMTRAARNGLDTISGSSATASGRLRMTAPAVLIETAFVRDLAAFMRACPLVTLEIDFSEQRRDLVREGLDLAIRIGRLESSSLKAKRLAVMERVFVASPSYVATKPTPTGLADLGTWDFIRLAALPPQLDLIHRRQATARRLTFTSRISTDSATAMRELVRAGAGVASLPEILTRHDLQRGRLVEVLPTWRIASRPVYAVWPGGTSRPELTARFVDFIEPRIRMLFASVDLER